MFFELINPKTSIIFINNGVTKTKNKATDQNLSIYREVIYFLRAAMLEYIEKTGKRVYNKLKYRVLYV